jgi:hypothetical protein
MNRVSGSQRLPVLFLLFGLGLAQAPVGVSAADPAAERWARAARRVLQQAARVESVRQQIAVTVRIGEQTDTREQRLEWIAPDKIRRTIFVEGGEQVVVINGDAGYLGLGNQTVPLPPQRLQEALDQLDRELLTLVTAAGDRQLAVLPAGSTSVGGSPCELLDLELRGKSSRVCVDERGDPLLQAYRGRDPLSGAEGLVEIVYSDHRDFGGVRFPARHEIRFDGHPVVEAAVKSIEINPELDLSLFVVPSQE